MILVKSLRPSYSQRSRVASLPADESWYFVPRNAEGVLKSHFGARWTQCTELLRPYVLRYQTLTFALWFRSSVILPRRYFLACAMLRDR